MADWRGGCGMEIQATPLPLASLASNERWKEVGVRGKRKTEKSLGLLKLIQG